MRALRDFNTPKIVTDDLPVFMGLIGDLFPALDVPRKRDLDFEKKVSIMFHKSQYKVVNVTNIIKIIVVQVKEAVLDLKLQAEDGFVLKVSSNYEGEHISLMLMFGARLCNCKSYSKCVTPCSSWAMLARGRAWCGIHCTELTST